MKRAGEWVKSKPNIHMKFTTIKFNPGWSNTIYRRNSWIWIYLNLLSIFKILVAHIASTNLIFPWQRNHKENWLLPCPSLIQKINKRLMLCKSKYLPILKTYSSLRNMWMVGRLVIQLTSFLRRQYGGQFLNKSMKNRSFL